MIVDDEVLLCTIVSCIEESHPESVQIEGFKLAQCIMMHKEACSTLLSFHSEPIVKAIVDAMGKWRWQDGKTANDVVSLLAEACRLATITRLPGVHHVYFWRMGIDKVLLNFLLPKFEAKRSTHIHLSLEECISLARESPSVNTVFSLRPYVWDILGSLAVHFAADFRPNKKEDGFHLEILLACACLAFDDIIRKGKQLLDDAPIMSRTEAAVRAVQMMIYSPCKYIASRTASILSKVLDPNAEGYLDYLMRNLKSKSSRDNLGMSELLQLVIHLICLTCFLALPWHESTITSDRAYTLIDFVRRCLSRPYSLARQTYAFHLVNSSSERVCCCSILEDWEGRDVLLFYGLWGLAEFLRFSYVKDLFARHKEIIEMQLLCEVRKICSDPSAGGARWFAACILAYFGVFGFPSKLGEIVGKARNDSNFVDIHLAFADGEKLCVHRVLLLVRCPSLLPPEDSPPDDGICNDSTSNSDSNDPYRKLQKEFTLSSRVGHTELVRLLDYVYLGYMHAEEDILKKLKALAQSCRLQPLAHLLSRRTPKWGWQVPNFDLSPALGQGGRTISDVILEAEATDSANWTCTVCSLLVPHMHLHKVILWASCDFLRAMLLSGMLESRSPVVKVPISWGALQILVKWFYSYNLPEPPTGCLWQNMGTEEKLRCLEPFIELSWLSGFWFIEGVQEKCLGTIMSRLDPDPKLSVKVLRVAAGLSQWELVEAAAQNVAGSYRKLKESGELDSLDDTLVEMVRAASVRLSQAAGYDP